MPRLYAPLLLSLLLACEEAAPPAAAPPTTPPPAEAPPAEAPPAEAPPAEAPPAAEAAAALPADLDPRLAEVFPPELLAELPALAAAQSAAEDAAQLAAAWQLAAGFIERADPHLDAWWEKHAEQTDPSWMDEVLPGLSTAVYAEGTALVLEHKQSTWSALAQQTADTADDAVFALTAIAWDNASGTGWPRWGVRNWDYGGCSTLGSGTHLEILKRIDHARGAPPPWDALVARTREGVLKDVLEGNAEFPYCDPTTAEPRPVKQIRLEVNAILTRATLSDAEKAALQARLEAAFPEG